MIKPDETGDKNIDFVTKAFIIVNIFEVLCSFID